MVKVSKLAVVRIKGSVDVSKEAVDTLRMLNLNRPNQCVLVDDDKSVRGMLQKIKEKITWGEISPDTLGKLLYERGELDGGEPVDDEVIKENTSYDSVEDFAEAVCDGESSLDDLKNLKEVFRLHPPRKGYKSTRRSAPQGRGAAGNREESINELISRMV